MKKIRMVLMVSLLMAGAIGVRAASTLTEQLAPGYNYVTCQVNGTGGNSINNTAFLGAVADGTEILVPNSCPLSGFAPPAAPPGGDFTAYFYAATLDDGLGFIGWYDGNTAAYATFVWNPGEGVIIFSPASSPQNMTFTGTPVPAGPPTFTVPSSGFCLVGSPTVHTLNTGYAVPADIISGIANGDAIYVYDNAGNATFYYYDSNQGGWVPNLPHFTPNYEAVYAGTIPSAIIEGFVYRGTTCSSTTPLNNWAVQAKAGVNKYYGVSDANGHYFIFVPPGFSYTVSSVAPTPVAWTPICNTSYTLSTVTAGNVYSGNNFVVKATPPANDRDLDVDLVSFFTYPLRTPCAGQPMTFVINYRNTGNKPIPFPIRIFLTGPGTYLSQNLSFAPGFGGGWTGTYGAWTMNATMNPGVSGKIEMTVTLPTTPTSGPLLPVPMAWTSFPAADSHPQDCVSKLHQNITCSMDPNDMQVDPQGCGPQGYIAPQQVLTYLVEFQNTGTAAANQVVVSNTLDPNLDVSTLQVLGSSHPNVLQVQGQQLVWTFPNIGLPDEAADDLESHGYVKYQVSPLASAPIGAVITNSAQIFFDLNAPISTVTVTNTITASTLPVASFTVTPVVGSDGQTNNFTYTGGSTGAQFLWNFGTNATPSTSTDENPAGVVFSGQGEQEVTLQVGLGGCESDAAAEIIYVGAPVLTAALDVDEFGMGWEGNGFHLQETTNLPPVGPWVATSATPSQFASGYSVSLPITNVVNFYRLSQVAP